MPSDNNIANNNTTGDRRTKEAITISFPRLNYGVSANIIYLVGRMLACGKNQDYRNYHRDFFINRI